MSKTTVTGKGKVRFTLTANQAEKVTLRPNAKSYAVHVDPASPASVRVGTSVGAVEGGATPTHYDEVAVGASFSEPVLQADAAETNSDPGSKHIWVFSTGAAILTVTDYPRI
jgi:hypothetical protein